MTQVLMYLNGSLHGGFKYKKSTQEEESFEGFVDSDYAGNVKTKKLILGFVFTLFGTIINWKAN